MKSVEALSTEMIKCRLNKLFACAWDNLDRKDPTLSGRLD